MSLKKLGRYDLIRVLGKGAMGLVYEGRDPNLERRVAIKTIKVENLSDEAAAEYEVRFRTEARSAARLQHPNIVSVYDSDRDGDIAYLVMEFIQGDDLKHHLDKGEAYSLQQTLGIMGDLLSALDYAHRQNIVHRDIKPANLLVEASGRIKLTDFGVARIQDSGEATRTQGSIVGTLKYMSPEQLQGRPIDARADLFAAGVVLYQLLTGRRPFDGDTDFAIIQLIVGHTPAAVSSINPKLPAAMDAVVAQALAKSREQRFATAREFASALQAASGAATDPTAVPPASATGRGRNSTWTATLRAGESLMSTQPGTGVRAEASTVTQEVELVYWKDIKESTDVEDVQGFLAKFPSGIYADLARRRLKKLGAGGAEDSDIGLPVRSGSWANDSATTLPEKTILLPARGVAGKTGDPQNSEMAWQALVAAAAEPPLPSASASPSAVVSVSAASQSASPEVAAVDLPTGGGANAITETQATKLSGTAATLTRAQRPLRLAWILAGIVALAAAAVGLKSLSGSGTSVPAVQLPAIVDARPAALPAATKESLPLKVATPVKEAAAASGQPASAVLRTAAPVAAVAKKALSDKDKPAKEIPEQAIPEKVAPVKSASASAGHALPSASAGPRQACEDRMLIGFQICMSEQCAKPAFSLHPVCLERRAMEQKRREADQNR